MSQGGIRPAALYTLSADHPCSLPASLQGARVLLTGASAGVGEELAYHSLCPPGLPPGAHCPHGGFPAEGETPISSVMVGVQVGWKMGPGFESLQRCQVSHVTLGKLFNFCEP